jgi:hypothetical protein
MCCSHHVGRKHLDEVSDCKKKCNGLINGIDWTLTEKKGEKGFQGTNKSTTTSSKPKDNKTTQSQGQKDIKNKNTNKGKENKKTNKGKDSKKTGKSKKRKTNPDKALEKLAKED